jgi:Fe-S cluster assembly protein SufD
MPARPSEPEHHSPNLDPDIPVQIEAKLLEELNARLARDEAHGGNGWATARRVAAGAFQQMGLPGKRSEAYKYTPLTRRVTENLTLDNAASAVQSATVFGDVDGIHVHTTNGLLNELPGDLPAGVTITSLSQSYAGNRVFVNDHLSRAFVADRDAFSSLAAAAAEDGILIHLAADVELSTPVVIHHDHVAAAGLVQPRVLVVADRNAKLQLVEHFGEATGSSAFENRIAEMIVAEGASVDHVLVYERGLENTFVNGLHVYQEGASHFATNTITLGGGMVRNNLHFLPDGEECETHLNGLYIARGSMHIDNHTFVDHAKPNCESNELFKGIVADKATGVFNGKILVRQDSQKINAYQSSKSIVLDRSASVYAKPELEIYADDVKCSHGATTGELDEEALFYLRARGIKPTLARLLLLEAFARDVVDLIDHEPVRAYLYTRLHTLLETHAA